jgi:hypothetical protein
VLDLGVQDGDWIALTSCLQDEGPLALDLLLHDGGRIVMET